MDEAINEIYWECPRSTVYLFSSLPCRTVFTDCLCVLPEDHSLFVLFLTLFALSLQIVFVCYPRTTVCLFYSHCLYRLFKCTIRGPLFVCFVPYPVALSLQIV